MGAVLLPANTVCVTRAGHFSFLQPKHNKSAQDATVMKTRNSPLDPNRLEPAMHLAPALRHARALGADLPGMLRQQDVPWLPVIDGRLWPAA